MSMYVAMHELTHAVGAGVTDAWFQQVTPFSVNPERAFWNGEHAETEARALIREMGSAPTAITTHVQEHNRAVLIIDGVHFAPFGMMYPGELVELNVPQHNILIATCRMMVAFLTDMMPTNNEATFRHVGRGRIVNYPSHWPGRV